MELCLGTVQLGMQYGIQNNGRPNRAETSLILSSALENGVCWFDTAAAYGDAETVLGDYLLEHPNQAERMHIVSKLAPAALAGEPRGKWRDIALKHAGETLARLRKRQMDVYMFHNASSIFDPDAVEALNAVCQEGLARVSGVSIYTPEEAMRALAYPEIKAVQIPYNVFDRRLDACGFFEAAQRKHVRVYARSSLLQGLAVMEAEKLPAHMRFAAPYIARFRSVCERGGVSPLQAAIGFAANHAGIHCLVFGVDNQRQLLEYISMASSPLSPQVLEELKGAFGITEERLVNPSLWNRTRVT